MCISHLNSFIQISAQAASNYSFKTTVPQNPNPLALSKWYKQELVEVNAQIDALENSHGIHNTCTSGCSYCCQQLIAVAKPEIIMLQFALSNMETTMIKKIMDKTHEQCGILSQNGFSANTFSNGGFLANTTEEEMKKSFFSLHLPCPFLNENNACMVYSVRPTLCWSYRNYGDPGTCTQSYAVPTAMILQDWESLVLKRLFVAKKPSAKMGLSILQFALLSSV